MKNNLFKIGILFFALIMFSCSSDDNSDDSGGSSKSELSVKVDGVHMVFNQFNISKNSNEVFVKGIADGDLGKIISFYTEIGDRGEYPVRDLRYTVNGREFSAGYNCNEESTFISAFMETSSNKKIKGIFTAVLGDGCENGALRKVELTDGAFEIYL